MRALNLHSYSDLWQGKKGQKGTIYVTGFHCVERNLTKLTFVNSPFDKILRGMTEGDFEKEVLDDEIGLKCNSGQKSKFQRGAVFISRMFSTVMDISKMLREIIREWNRMMDAGTPPAWPPRFYPRGHPETVFPPESPESSKPKRRSPKK